MPWPTFFGPFQMSLHKALPRKKKSPRLPPKVFSWPFIWESHEKSFIRGIETMESFGSSSTTPKAEKWKMCQAGRMRVSCDTREPVLVLMILKIEFSPEELNTERTLFVCVREGKGAFWGCFARFPRQRFTQTPIWGNREFMNESGMFCVEAYGTIERHTRKRAWE